MDIDQARLDGIHGLASRYTAELGVELALHKTTDRREAMRGADIVVNAALAAGHHRLRAGWDVARPLGYRWGGSLHVMHDEAYWINFYQYRLFESLLDDLLDVCPQAWYIQVANPVKAGITYLARRYPQAKVVGLCHGAGEVYHLAETIGLDPAQISFEVPGVNHFIWLTKLFHRGQDAMPLLDRWIAEQAERAWAAGRGYGPLNPKKVAIYQRVGAFPVGDLGGDGGGSWGWEFLWTTRPSGATSRTHGASGIASSPVVSRRWPRSGASPQTRRRASPSASRPNARTKALFRWSKRSSATPSA
jgi:alpha-galactosidase